MQSKRNWSLKGISAVTVWILFLIGLVAVLVPKDSFLGTKSAQQEQGKISASPNAGPSIKAPFDPCSLIVVGLRA